MKKFRVAIIGYGQRGCFMLRDTFPLLEDAEVVAVCDVYEDRAADAKKAVKDTFGIDAFSTTDYREILARDDVDVVYVMTSWETHIDVAIDAMKAKKAVMLEVGCAYSVEDCWKLVNTYEETKTPIMFMENCCYDKSELFATAIARKGKFGKIVHCSGAYGHDLREEITSGKKIRHYRLRNYILRNCENYPTHELGPIAKILDINRGNRMLSVVSIASGAFGLNDYIEKNRDKMDPELLTQRFAQGDVVNTLITCANGETIALKLDTTLPRYYSREFVVRGTNGCYEQNSKSLFFDGDAEFDVDYCHTEEKYYDEFLPDMWKNITEEEKKGGHGGMDIFELRAFFKALRNGTEMPIDVYDGASWMVISALSEQSIQQGGAPVAIPDFTRGKWTVRKRLDVIEFDE